MKAFYGNVQAKRLVEVSESLALSNKGKNPKESKSHRKGKT